MWGDSADYGDSGGIQFQGEAGRDATDPTDPTGKSSHKHHKCIGVHCSDGEDAMLFLVLFGVAFGLYTTGGLYYGITVRNKSGLAALPNANFWSEVGGLVKDGAAFALSGGTAKAQPRPGPSAGYQPVPEVGSGPAAAGVVVTLAQAVPVVAVVMVRLQAARPPQLAPLPSSHSLAHLCLRSRHPVRHGV